MSAPYLLDTNIATYLMTGRSRAARERFAVETRSSRITISAITQGEMCFGLENKHKAGLPALVEEFLGTVRILPWDTPAAKAYGRLRAQMTAAGKSLTTTDMLIAAHAVAIGAVLVTHDKAFRHVSDLAGLEDWATDLTS